MRKERENATRSEKPVRSAISGADNVVSARSERAIEQTLLAQKGPDTLAGERTELLLKRGPVRVKLARQAGERDPLAIACLEKLHDWGGRVVRVENRAFGILGVARDGAAPSGTGTRSGTTVPSWPRTGSPAAPAPTRSGQTGR